MADYRPRGTCSVCGWTRHLRNDGTLGRHPYAVRSGGSPCSGAGLAPGVPPTVKCGPVVSLGEPERWLAVVGYEGFYEVSDLGRVRSLRMRKNGGLLHQLPNVHGYLVVHLCVNWVRDTCPVHQLVAAALLGPRPVGEEVRHLNGDRVNNACSNLAYGTSRENKLDSVQHGTHTNAGKTHCPQGHEYTPENTYRYPSRPNNRICRTCERERRQPRKAA